MSSRIIVALDGMEPLAALKFAAFIGKQVWGFKGNDLLDQQNADAEINALCQIGLFADIKAHDIPNTVANRVAAWAKRNARLITVHASGGVDMMKAAVEVYEKHKPHNGLGILAVTVLTSLDANRCRGIYAKEPEEMVLKLADFADEAGAYGIVCSAQELVALKGKHPRLKRIVPGTRSKDADTHDQARVDTQENAIKNGADLLVIGREITKAEDPVAVCERINGYG